MNKEELKKEWMTADFLSGVPMVLGTPALNVGMKIIVSCAVLTGVGVHSDYQ